MYMCFFSVCIIKPKVYHTTRNDPQICPESAFFHNNLSTSSGAACRPRAPGSTPPAHSGRSNLPCTREGWESWTWKTVIYGDRLEPVPVIKIHQNTIFDSAAVLFFVVLPGASGVGLRSLLWESQPSSFLNIRRDVRHKSCCHYCYRVENECPT